MKIIFSGAGASVDAGYPLTKGLLSLIKNEYKESQIINDRRDWELFDAFSHHGHAISKAILQSTNPEVIFSHLDILVEALSESDQEWWRQLKSAVDLNNYGVIKKLQGQLDSPVREYLFNGKQAKSAITRLIDRFFSHRHYLEQQCDSQSREYLHRAMTSLGDGDIVIGTNWDTLAETVLLEQGKWYPGDGYGFIVPLICRISRQSDKEFTQRSLVKVLKLHGSIGWHQDQNGQIYLRHPGYLQYFSMPDCSGRLLDRNAPPSGNGPDGNPVMIYPSYLKPLDDHIILRIWQQAAEALSVANEIEIVGYSLPKADSAVRALLLPLCTRLEQKDVKITVVNRNNDILGEWKAFLGNAIQTCNKKAAEYY